MDLAKIGSKGRLGEPHAADFPGLRAWAPVLLLLAFFPFRASSQSGSLGPLTWEEGGPVHRIAHTPAFESSDVIPRGELSSDLWLGFSNIFEQDSAATHVVFLDTERLLSSLSVRWGAVDRLEVGARLTLETTGGGVLDSFVHWYHERMGFGQANRDRFPEDQYSQRLTDGGAMRYVDLRRRTLGLADVQLFAKWSLIPRADGGSALSVRFAGRVPMRANQVAPERADAAVVVLGRLGSGPWHLHGMLGAGMVRASPELDPVLREATGFFGFAVERALGGSLAAIVQYQLTSPVLTGFGHRELDWPASNLIFGLAGRWGEAWSWDASFQEDVPADTPAIDFTLALRVSRRWR